MICAKCQAQLAGNAKFCPKCGAKAPGQPTPEPLANRDQGRDQVALTSVAKLSPTEASVSVASAGSPGQDLVVCPACGTCNLASAKFCKKDGVRLHDSAPTDASPAPRTPLRFPGERRFPPKAMVAAAGAVVFAITALTAGSLYWTGYIGDRQGAIAQEINTRLGSKGLSNVKVLVDKHWRATAEGLVASAAEKDLALAMIREHGQLKEPISDLIRVRPTRAELQAILDKAAANTGIPQASAQIDDSLTTVTIGGADLVPEARARMEQALSSALSNAGAPTQVRFVSNTTSASPGAVLPTADGEAITGTLNEQLRAAALSGVSAELAGAGRVRLQGTVLSQEQHDRAVQIAASQAGVSGVIDLLQIAAPPSTAANRDPAKLEGEINRGLRSNGLGGITALVADDFSVTLKGSVNSAENKNRAFQLVRQFPVKGLPKDRVFVVE